MMANIKQKKDYMKVLNKIKTGYGKLNYIIKEKPEIYYYLIYAKDEQKPCI